MLIILICIQLDPYGRGFSNGIDNSVHVFRWLSARFEYLQCVSNGDTAVLH